MNTGRGDSQRLLEQLERRNLFVVPLDDRRRWYRYHHLFADVLHARLLAERPEQVPDLHRRASAWFAAGRRPLIDRGLQTSSPYVCLERTKPLRQGSGPDIGARRFERVHCVAQRRCVVPRERPFGVRNQLRGSY